MKSTLKEIEENEYPRLMIDKEQSIIVLFIGKGNGIVVNSASKGFFTGNSDDDWNMDYFTNYNGTVTLEN